MVGKTYARNNVANNILEVGRELQVNQIISTRLWKYVDNLSESQIMWFSVAGESGGFALSDLKIISNKHKIRLMHSGEHLFLFCEVPFSLLTVVD